MTKTESPQAGERTQTTKPTKGPWHVQIVNGKTMIACHPFADDGSMQIAEVTGLKGKGKTQANARLIAAVPELLDACKALWTQFNGDYFLQTVTTGVQREAMILARDAIAKVEGRDA